jgi:hypothetical protein
VGVLENIHAPTFSTQS